MPRPRISGTDPEDFDVLDRARRRPGPGLAGASKRTVHVRAAYQFLLENVSLRWPSCLQEFVSPSRPDWAVRRAFTCLVEAGVLVGPEEAPRAKGNGEAIWYSFEGIGYVAWLEGAWRSRHHPLRGEMLARLVNERRKGSRFHNRRVGREPWMAKSGRPERPPPRESYTAGLRHVLSGLPVFDWDGMIYLPSGTPKMKAVTEWRREMAEMAARSRFRRCGRCGLDYPVGAGTAKSAHPVEECMVVLAKLVMET